MRFGSAKTNVSRITPFELANASAFRMSMPKLEIAPANDANRIRPVARHHHQPVYPFDLFQPYGDPVGRLSPKVGDGPRSPPPGAPSGSATEIPDELRVGGMAGGHFLDAVGFQFARQLLPRGALRAPELLQAPRDLTSSLGSAVLA